MTEETRTEPTVYDSIRENLANAKAKILAPAKKAYEKYQVRKDQEAQAKKDLELKAQAIERLFKSPEFKVFQEFAKELEQEMVRSWMHGGEKDYSMAAWLLNELRERPKKVIELSAALKTENTRG